MGVLDLIFPKTCLSCDHEGKYICDSCLAKVRHCGMREEAFSVFRYEGVIRKAIISLKYKYSTEIAKELADLCIRNLKSANLTTKNYLLIPIPLHWHRQNIRGFNQSEEIGKLVAKGMNWKYEPNLLVKTISTKSQVSLKSGLRHKNLKGVFSLNPNCVLSTAYPVLIFDDVFTTGSTIREATKVLKHAGFERIWGVTIAR
jgi:competence protein ComFC